MASRSHQGPKVVPLYGVGEAMKTVGDIMEAHTVQVSPETTVRKLAAVLHDAQISGAPVVDAQDRLVGVVSATDIVRLASEPAVLHRDSTWLDELDGTSPGYYSSFFLEADGDPGTWALPSEEPALASFDEATVKDIMTSVPFTIPAETSVAVLADFLSERHIHRAVVTGPNGLAGMVTALDVVGTCRTQGGDESSGE